jgi:hypothetical protein
MARRFPKPWKVCNSDGAYWVEDANGNQFGFTYFRDDLAGTIGRAYLSRDEARRMASNIAKLPDLLGR